MVCYSRDMKIWQAAGIRHGRSIVYRHEPGVYDNMGVKTTTHPKMPTYSGTIPGAQKGLLFGDRWHRSIDEKIIKEGNFLDRREYSEVKWSTSINGPQFADEIDWKEKYISKKGETYRKELSCHNKNIVKKDIYLNHRRSIVGNNQENSANTKSSILGPIPSFFHPSTDFSNHKNLYTTTSMSIPDEILIAQFAALSANEDDPLNEIEIPESAVRAWDWPSCMVMKVMASRNIFDATFSTALRRAWPVHPDTQIEGLGNNCFLVEFKTQDDLLKVIARGTWMCGKDMVVSRMALGPEDLTNPQINYFECWVEVHGIPPESLDQTGLKKIMKEVGTPVSAGIKSFYHANQRVYKQKLEIDMREPLKPKLPLKHPQLGRIWLYVVYDNIANVCMFCARVGHEHVACPAKLRLKIMKQAGDQQLDGKEIPETMVGRWVMDRAYVPRKEESSNQNQKVGEGTSGSLPRTNSADASKNISIPVRSLKRQIDLNLSEKKLITMGQQADDVEKSENGDMRLNFKRAKEANPNSPSRFAQ